MGYAQTITRFALGPRTKPYDEWNGKTLLLRDGEQTPFLIKGCELKAQYQCGNYFLLATEYDCPYEEAVTLTLLASDSKPLASSTVPQILYPVVAAPSYWFDKIVWNDDHFFDLHIKDLHHHFHYTIRDFNIPFLYPRLCKRTVKNQ